MIIFLLNTYLVLLFLLVKFKVVRFNLFWKSSPFIVLLLLLIGLFIPMNWGAPAGPVLLGRHSVAIVPDVSGEVTEVSVQANVPVRANDVLFRIDAIPYRAQVRTLEAQLAFAQLRLDQMTQLERTSAGRAFDVQQRESEVSQIKAQLEGAKWNLDKTVVRAPADGYVTNLALRKGARVSNPSVAPVMAFIDTSGIIAAVNIQQIDARYIEPGQQVELTFKYLPGQILTGKVETVLQAISTGQIQASGLAVTPKEVAAAPFVVRVILDDNAAAQSLPAGSVGTAAIFTEHVTAAHIIRRVLLRQEAILNYIIPF
jgi:RND family efflux transporter MFP subunit